MTVHRFYSLILCIPILLVGIVRAQELPSFLEDLGEDIGAENLDLRTLEFFNTAGKKLGAVESEHEVYWSPHLNESHRRITRALHLVEQKGVALVLGAGKCREVPLEKLASDFERVILVDLDFHSMQQAVEAIPGFLRDKVEIRVSDITTFVAPFMKTARHIIAAANDVQEARMKLESLYANPGSLAQTADFPRADFVVSSLVLAELARYPNAYVAGLFSEKFGSAISKWRNYEQLRSSLFHFVIEDHARLLERILATSGVIYFADTIARGPALSSVSKREREKVLRELATHFGRIGVFRTIQAQAATWNTFVELFGKLYAINVGHSNEGENIVQPTEVIANIENSDDALEDWKSAVVAETVIRLLCKTYLPVDTEIAVYRLILERYQAITPNSMELLVDYKTFFKILAGYGLKPSGTVASWIWLEYPCSIPRKPGAFLVNSWMLQWAH